MDDLLFDDLLFTIWLRCTKQDFRFILYYDNILLKRK